MGDDMDFRLHLEPDETQADMYENVEYHNFWEGVERRHLDRLEQVLIRRMLKLPARRLVDIGCGFGRLANIYLDKCQEVVMVDSSWSQLQQARETTGGRCTYIASNATRLPLRPGSFDRALLIRVFHHIPMDQAESSLDELARILCGGGQLLFTYSNKRNLERIVKWLMRKLPYNPFDPSTAYIWEAFTMQHPKAIRRGLIERGFDHFDLRGSGIMDKIAGRAGGLWKRVPLGVGLAPLFGRLSLAPWIFVGGEKTDTGADGTDTADLPEAYLQCPACSGDLTSLPESYQCQDCGRGYPIRDGIIDFRTG